MKNALKEPQTIVLLGGSSEIGRAIVSALITPATTKIVLAGRDPSRLDPNEFDTEADVMVEEFDADRVDTHAAFAQRVADECGDIDVVIVAFGVLGDADRLDGDPAAAAAVAHTNFTGAVSSTMAFVPHLTEQGHGQLVVLSSVAGERGRASNFVYGSTKAGLDAFAQGLGDALNGTGVKMLVVRPGFVHSKMTEGLDAAPMATTPEKVAELTVNGMKAGAHTVWAPSTLRYVFSVLRHVPRPIFKRLPI